MSEQGDSGMSSEDVIENSSHSFTGCISDSRDMAVVEIDQGVGLGKRNFHISKRNTPKTHVIVINCGILPYEANMRTHNGSWWCV